MQFGEGKILLELFDLTKTPIPLAVWEKQVLLISDGVELNISDFTRTLRDKETAHYDPKTTKELEATRSLVFVEGGRELRQQKVVIAIGQYVVHRIQQIVFPSAESMSRWGLELVNHKQYSEAIELFKRALTYQPDYALAFGGWGFALLHQGKFEEAVAEFNRALGLQPCFPVASNNLGLALCFVGREDQAIAEFERATKCNADYIDPWFNWGVSLAHVGKNEEALGKFDEVLNRTEFFPAALHAKGVILVALGRYSEAIAQFEKAIEQEPNFADAWFEWGVTLDNLGQRQEAVQRLRYARKLGCSRSLRLPYGASAVILTRWMGTGKTDDPRRGAVTSEYILRSAANLSDQPSWPKDEPCPFYGCLIAADAEDEVLTDIQHDTKYLLIVGGENDPDLSPDAGWYEALRNWFLINGMSSAEYANLADQIANLRFGELWHLLNEWLNKPRNFETNV